MMTSIAALVVVVVLYSQLINAIGKSHIGEALWDLYLNISRSQTSKDLRAEKAKAIKAYEKRANVSSKDEFAAWAKLDREYNKCRGNIEKLNGELASEKSRFKMVIKGLLFAITTGMKIFVRVWHRKSAVLWLNTDIVSFPNWLLWLLSMSAPRGSISVSSWLFIVDTAVTGFIGLFLAFKGLSAPFAKQQHRQQSEQAQLKEKVRTELPLQSEPVD